MNRVLKKVEMTESGISFGYVGKKEDFRLIGIGDASFKTSEKAVGGIVLLLASRDLKRAFPIHWKSKIMERVCYSSKGAEMLILSKMMEDALFAAQQIDTMLFGGYERRTPINLFTDSEGMLESIASTKQIERKSLRMVIQDLKE